MNHYWSGGDLPFGTVIHSDRVGTMLIVAPPVMPHIRRSTSTVNLGHDDHGAIWLQRFDAPDEAPGEFTWLAPFALEKEYEWRIIEGPA